MIYIHSLLQIWDRAPFGQHQESRPENAIRLLCANAENWTFPDVVILGADQKDPRHWGRDWIYIKEF